MTINIDTQGELLLEKLLQFYNADKYYKWNIKNIT